MSATVETIYFYGASCDDCLHAFGPDESEAAAEEWAATHDAEHHAEDDGLDDDYEAFKEARYDVL